MATQVNGNGNSQAIFQQMQQQFAQQATQQQQVQALASKSQQDSQNRTLGFQTSTEMMKNAFDCCKESIKNGAKTQ
ncbi:hypothetical protein [Variovorax sp.]|uniref:hypothetical protein n=1 Tax=Variovorax sp. TaxID=1871043 RepID=UPI002D601171|nr:hypothetical protein [Variovorax sp.]HYP82993.1 hypothetical protein [Variovorax sp.]